MVNAYITNALGVVVLHFTPKGHVNIHANHPDFHRLFSSMCLCSHACSPAHVLSRTCHWHFIFTFLLSKFSHKVPEVLLYSFICVRALTPSWMPCAASPGGGVDISGGFHSSQGFLRSTLFSSAHCENLRAGQELQHLSFIHRIGECSLSLPAEAACSWPNTFLSHLFSPSAGHSTRITGCPPHSALRHLG